MLAPTAETAASITPAAAFPHVNNFDLLRLFAACQVVAMHLGHLHVPDGWPWTSLLWTVPGVPIFFVISGFLVTDSAMRSRSVGSYFKKRALRIYPALIVNIAILDLLMYLTGASVVAWDYFAVFLPLFMATASSWMAWQVSGFAPYIGAHHFFPTYPSGVLGTLTMELTFYLVVPAIAWLALRSRVTAAVIVGLAAVASAIYQITTVNLAFIENHPALTVTCLGYFWIFSVGILVRLLWDKIGWLFEGKALLWLAANITLSLAGPHFNLFSIYVVYSFDVDVISAWRVVLLGCTVLSCALSFKGASAYYGANAARAWLRIDPSYGIYLWHMLVIYTFLAFGITGHWWLWIAVGGCVVPIALASWRFIEEPALALKNRIRPA